jgi:hypothetical protein
MSDGGTFRTMGAFSRKFQRDMGRVEQRLEAARTRAAQKTASYVRAHVPVAFGELRDSVRAEGTRVIADAPHAQAVELGSRPHWMPLQPLIDWVTLRGFQGLHVSDKSRARLPGTTTLRHANQVGAQLRAAASEGTDTDSAAVGIAKAIQLSISIHGTKPHYFMRGAIPQARDFLTAEIEAVFSRV